MRKMLTLFVAVALVSGFAFAAIAQDKGPAEIKMPVNMGDVTFSHGKHQEMVGDCAICHHTGLDDPSCKSCHGSKPDAPKAKKVFHKLCKDCHKKEAGPTKCKECHIK
ncbi:Class III cytochrome C family protein [Malonomonas rubra DSM 5091]|uniref:Class III cytochrome C family protein n=1 Tax=Malonomonas rubra DSM 5091 TaxID=1122189 RepID=A0A1M6B9V1_MALRU|nr:cytochrome c3 family protein [Malonomonas rubra]SHI45466.1 Class III cytochrome C family protein [Malonomonas rubra DSM 5091]